MPVSAVNAAVLQIRALTQVMYRTGGAEQVAGLGFCRHMIERVVGKPAMDI